jgi:ubiquinone/menaquinone biosynthesis C-methylase UbiE
MSESAANEEQIAFWNGAAGAKWVRMQAGLDAFLEQPLDELMKISNPKPGDHVLDVGCGAGASTFDLAQRVAPKGSVTGIDISRPLLELAARRAKDNGFSNVTFVEADAQTHEFNEASFDLIASRFGMTFFEDPVAAISRLGMSLKLRGRIAFVTLASIDDNPWFTIPRDVAMESLGTPAPVDPLAPSPFAFASIERVLLILRDAGFDDCAGDRRVVDLEFAGSLNEAARIMTNLGPASRIIAEFHADEQKVNAIQDEVAARISCFEMDGVIRVPGTINLFSAIRSR